MFRKPVFWAAFAALSIACTAFAVVNLPRAFSIVELDLEMDRAAALSEAGRLAGEFDWGPADYRQAASFRVDDRARSFVELEGGGPEVFAGLLRDGPFHPYQWVVRNFRGGEVREAEVRFRPDGAPYGFRETLAEDAPGAALDSDAARAVAEAGAGAPWDVPLDRYEPVEASQAERPGGRIDHTFVYEHTAAQAGEGRFRLRLVVRGDRLTELTHVLQVPEAFDRRYEEMRSANVGIGIAGQLAMYLIYGGGIAIGLFLLLRQRRVLWRMAFVWGVSIAAFAQLLAGLNQWPLLWMAYDTAVSETSFAIQQVTTQVGAFLAFTGIYTLSFMAAESLSRRAFPHHLQLWRCWSQDGARTWTVLGQTVAGYLIVGIDLAFVVGFYWVTIAYLGWWSPSDAMVSPDLLATVLPWLSPLAISLHAGFWEECLFRAVPLAGAALIGDRYGNRRAWIAGAFVLQILIFGAAHAGYPTQPSYARVVELIVPSTIFGLLYLRFGLLPAIVLHFAFDAVLIGTPLFLSSAPGAWVDQGIYGLIFLVPLWVALRARYRGGAWTEAPASLRNAAWTPPAEAPAAEAPPPPAREVADLPSLPAVAAVGVVGFGLWAYTAATPSESPGVGVGRAEAVAAAREVLAGQGVDPAAWTETSQVFGVLGPQHRFVWSEAGEEAHRTLLGDYLAATGWRVRYARFEGDVAARAEEHIVWIASDGTPWRREHRLAEGTPGASLPEEAARALARDAVVRLGRAADLPEVSAESASHPARTDWTFIFRDETVPDLAGGEARVAVEIAGDEVVDTRRYVFLPEAWRRADEQRRASLQIASVASTIVLRLLLVAGAVLAVVRMTRKTFDLRLGLAVAGLLLLANVANLANAWPVLMNGLSTAQPLPLQLGISLAFNLGIAGLVAVLFGLLAGAGPAVGEASETKDQRSLIGTGVAMGLGALGALALAEAAVGRGLPPWSVHWPASFAAPWLAASAPGLAPYLALNAPLLAYLALALVTLLIVTLANRLTAHWTRRKAAVGAGLVLIGALLAPGMTPDNLASWAVVGLTSGALLLGAYVLVLRDRPALVVLAAATMTVPGVLDRGLDQAYGGALPGALLGAALVSGVAWVWFAHLLPARRA